MPKAFLVKQIVPDYISYINAPRAGCNTISHFNFGNAAFCSRQDILLVFSLTPMGSFSLENALVNKAFRVQDRRFKEFV